MTASTWPSSMGMAVAPSKTATVGRHRPGLESPRSGRTVRGHPLRADRLLSGQRRWWARPVPAARGQISRKAHSGGQRGLGHSPCRRQPASTQTRHHAQHHSEDYCEREVDEVEWQGGRVTCIRASAATTRREARRELLRPRRDGRWPSQASTRKRRPFGARHDPRQVTGSGQWGGPRSLVMCGDHAEAAAGQRRKGLGVGRVTAGGMTSRMTCLPLTSFGVTRQRVIRPRPETYG